MPEIRFLDDDGMDFAVRCVLSGVRYGMAEVGEVLALLADVTDGDPASWVDRWVAAGRSARRVADAAAAAGRDQSAWPAYLRAANYLFCGNYYTPATEAAERSRSLWEEHRACWDRAVDHWPTPVRRLRIPYADTTLPGYWFAPRSVDGGHPRPVVVIVNGIDTPMSDTAMTGLVDGVDRGHHVVCFDGPGQGAALYQHGLTMGPVWDAVLGSVLDVVAERADADPERVAVTGINHGGLFATAGVAAHPERVAALVLDPAVRVLVDDAVGALPAQLAELYRAEPDSLDAAVASSADPDVRFLARTVGVPFGAGSVRAALDGLAGMTIDAGTIARVTCPTYVADAEAAQSFAGQASGVIAALGGPTHVDRFTTAEGAGLDCEILAPQIRNQRVYDWLGDVLGVGGGR